MKTAFVKRGRRAVWAYGYRGATMRAIRAMRHRREEPDHFDTRYGTDTAGIVRLERLVTRGSNGRYAVRYQPSEPDATAEALRSLPINHDEFTFIDVGSGKGRVLLVAAELPFKRVIGVEFAEDLCRIAERNARISRHYWIEVVCMDATEYELPAEPLVLYFYNPFLAPIMRSVMARAGVSLRDHPRPAYVVLAGDDGLATEIEIAGFVPVASCGPPRAWRWPIRR